MNSRVNEKGVRIHKDYLFMSLLVWQYCVHCSCEAHHCWDNWYPKIISSHYPCRHSLFSRLDIIICCCIRLWGLLPPTSSDSSNILKLDKPLYKDNHLSHRLLTSFFCYLHSITQSIHNKWKEYKYLHALPRQIRNIFPLFWNSPKN